MEIIVTTGEINIDPKVIEEKVEALLDDTTMEAIHRVFAEIIDPWTPFLSGALHEQIEITAQGVNYTVPYARDKYYGEVYCKDNHPLATSHWDEVAMETQLPVFKARVIDILRERAKQLYG